MATPSPNATPDAGVGRLALCDAGASRPDMAENRRIPRTGVLARWGDTWYRARIAHRNNDGTFMVYWDGEPTKSIAPREDIIWQTVAEVSHARPPGFRGEESADEVKQPPGSAMGRRMVFRRTSIAAINFFSIFFLTLDGPALVVAAVLLELAAAVKSGCFATGTVSMYQKL